MLLVVKKISILIDSLTGMTGFGTNLEAFSSLSNHLVLLSSSLTFWKAMELLKCEMCLQNGEVWVM